MSLKVQQASVTLSHHTMGPEAWLPRGSISGRQALPHSTKTPSCPPLPLSELASPILREFLTWRKPAAIWAPSRTREMLRNPVLTPNRLQGRLWASPGHVGAGPDRGLGGGLGATGVLGCSALKGSKGSAQFLTGSHTPAFS